MALATAFPAMHRFLRCLPRDPGKGIVKDHYQVFRAQGLAAVVTHRDDLPALIVALRAFPGHYRVILSRPRWNPEVSEWRTSGHGVAGTLL
jgi:hypothetical protein